MFTSTSEPFREPWTPLTRAEWSIDGVGTLEGNQVTVTAPAAGPWSVALHVWDAIGEDDVEPKVIDVQSAPPPPPPPPPPNQPPSAGNSVLPASPLVGEGVTLVSYSEDPDGRISDQLWDINGDGYFDEATGPVVSRTFSIAGNKQVSLRVTDDQGASSTVSRTFTVRVPPPATSSGASTPESKPPPTLSSPFPAPIVRVETPPTPAPEPRRRPSRPKPPRVTSAEPGAPATEATPPPAPPPRPAPVYTPPPTSKPSPPPPAPAPEPALSFDDSG
jgi:PKD domain